MSSKILGPNGVPIDLSDRLGFTPEQLKFLARNVPTLGTLPENIEHGSRSERHRAALQTMLLKITSDNFQLWTMLATLLDHFNVDTSAVEPNIEFTQLQLAKFADPRTWPTIIADGTTGNVRIAPTPWPAVQEEVT